MPYKIAIVDDRSQVLLALTAEMKDSGLVEVVFTAQNGEDYLNQMKVLPFNNYPRVVLMDIEMPIMNGIDAVKKGRILYTGVDYIMFTVFDGDDKLFEALKAGAKGYLLKNEKGSIILNAVEDLVDRNGAPMSPAIARKTLNLLINQKEPAKENEPLLMTLSSREKEILEGLVHGLDYRQLAANLLVSPNTVRNHISAIYTKLHITSKAQAIHLAIKNKWV